MKVDQLETFLRGAACFAVLSDEQLRTVRERCEIRPYQLGQVVFRQGDPGDRMYLVYSGKVRVLREENGREVPLNTLYPGEHFGELALVSRQPRSATIRAAADSTLVAVPAAAVEELLGANAELRRYFSRYAERLELWNFIKLVARVGHELKPAQLRRLVDQFQEARFEVGEEILVQGQVPERFYLVQVGRVKVLKGGQVQVTLASGDTFGSASLLHDPPRPSPWQIVADGPVQLLTLAATDFRLLLAQVPALRRHFEEQLSAYEADGGAGDTQGARGQGSGVRDEQPRTAAESAAAGLAPVLGPERWQREEGDRTLATGGPSAADEIETAAGVAQEPSPQEKRFRLSTLDSRLSTLWARWRFPFIPQHEEVDCGAACLAMITAHQRRPVGVSRLRDLAGVSTEGASLAQLAAAAHEIGYEARGLRISADELSGLRLPAVLLWRGYHYVVLYALTPRHAYVADPAMGKQRLRREELATHFSGFALEVQSTEAAVKVRTQPTAARRMISLLAQHKGTLAAILGASLLLDLFGLATPFFTQRILDDVLPSASFPLLNLLLLGMVLVSGLQITTTVLRSLTAVRLSQKLDRVLLGDFYAHLLALPTRFFKLRRTGDIVARFDDNQHVRGLFTAGTMTAVLDSLMVFVYFAMMFYYSGRLALVVLAFLPLFIGLTALASPVMKSLSRRLLEDRAAHESALIETISGIDLVKAMAVEQPMRRKWEAFFAQFLASQLRREKLGETFAAAGSALGVISSVALLWYGATLVLGGSLSVGQLIAFNMLAGQVTGPLARLIGLWDQVQQARVSLERLSDVLDNEPERQAAPESRLRPERIRGHVKLERVFFHYGGKHAPYVLRSVSFEAHPGQRIAIVGRSGSGKTTLARLLLGLYPPTEGRITVDGWDLAHLDLAAFRRQVGVVLQENLLFSGTIRDNIALGDPQPDLDRVVEAAQLAGADEFVAVMPLRYDTIVGELGLTLSGGQRQRVSLARALYRDPRILILDEATSHLDSLSEREIQKNFDRILADRTAFIIAHKIATVRDADLILVLHDGTLVEQGTHDELIARRGPYYYLAAQQLNL